MIKRDATSRSIMESLATSSFYTGEVTLYEGYFLPKNKYPNNCKICLTTSNDDFYVVSNDNKFIPFRYSWGFLLLITSLFSVIHIINGNPFLIVVIPSFFWLVSRITRFFLKNDVQLFLERYYYLKNEYYKNSLDPNRY
ncbi:hypothetical protein [Nonlabens dokdonensis]|uniref:Uncharacterized protein n=2 Tax=Nonlabens dokdonensis TaxID=328515 RepID=L7WBS3_NONDD|nr:hypothetical protein [Nonlabens dokdonensis]AGC77564.1 hypothetical protein DDD_2438 [Nonlabens dokdonensis DSW-6]